MTRAAVVAVLFVLCVAACARVWPAVTDARLVKAQRAHDERQRLEQAGKYAEALLQEERALALGEEALGKEHPDILPLLHRLAQLHLRQGHYARAEQLFTRALAIEEATHGPDQPEVTASLHNLAYLAQKQGQYTRVEGLYRRVLAINEAVLGKEHPDIASTLEGLAGFYHSRRQYSRAEPLYARALAIREAALGKEHPDVASSLNNLASTYMEQGQGPRAKPLLKRALAIREAALGKEHPDVAKSLSALARYYQQRGLYPLVEGFLKRALPIEEAALGKEHPDVAISLHNLALAHHAQGNYAQAEPLYRRALAINQAALGERHPSIATSLNSLAALLKDQGKYAQAEPLYERALALREETLGRDHPDVATLLSNQGHLQLAQHRLDKALPLFERALVITEQHLRQETFSFSEERLAGVLSLLREYEECLFTLVRAYPGDERVRRLALTAALLRKGRSLHEIANTSRIISRSLSPSDRETFERLRALRARISMLSLAGPEGRSPSDLQEQVKPLDEQGDALEAELARRSEPLRALYALPPPMEMLGRVAASLPKDGVLVEFVTSCCSTLVHTPESVLSHRPSDVHYLALVLFADGRTHAIDLGSVERIDRAALRLHQVYSGRAASLLGDAQVAFAFAFSPLMPLLAGKAQQVFLAPDGQLALIPFAALHDGGDFLLERWNFTYLTSGQELLRRAAEPPATRSVVVLADPAFDAPSPAPAGPLSSPEAAPLLLQAGQARASWPPLPATRQEARAIQKLLPQARLYLGPDATKEVLLTQETPAVLHIATHGYYLEEAVAVSEFSLPPSAAALATRATVIPGLPELGPLQRPPDPLVRSGLVLTGATSSQGRLEDSLVTALELTGLNLWGTQLVVLSACETGLGDVKEPGQGVYGLRRALVVAGAETVVTSLWKVKDGTTAELMEGYYRRLLAGQGRTTALREAMRELRRRKPHPHDWAPFIAMGLDAPLRLAH